MIRIVSICLTVTLAIVAILTVGLTLKQNIKTMKNVVVRNNFEKHGVTLISSNNESFDTELANYLKGNQEGVTPFIDAVKPFTVFVKNTSTKDIVGISLRWEITSYDGSVQSFPQIESSHSQLMGIKPRNSALKKGLASSLIPSNSSRFFVLDMTVQQLVRNESQRATINDSSSLNGEKLKHFNEYLPQLQARNQKTMNDAISVSISIDGIFFSDGTFIGDDQNHFFAYMKGALDARRDFIKEMQGSVKAKKNTAEIFSRLESLASYKPLSINELDSEEKMYAESYKAQLRVSAKKALAKKKKLSEREVVEEIAATELDNWIPLIKENK